MFTKVKHTVSHGAEKQGRACELCCFWGRRKTSLVREECLVLEHAPVGAGRMNIPDALGEDHNSPLTSTIKRRKQVVRVKSLKALRTVQIGRPQVTRAGALYRARWAGRKDALFGGTAKEAEHRLRTAQDFGR
jgi:hypothetical protein